MNPVSSTAYYCCAVRALDAVSPTPILGDQLAARFMTPAAWALFEPFRPLTAPNASNVARHRIIDDLPRTSLQSRPEIGVVIIGAGFDTRAFRLPAGRWVELDEPALITLKEVELPAHSAPNPLTRVAIEFDREPLAVALAPFRDLPNPIVVLEGAPDRSRLRRGSGPRTLRGGTSIVRRVSNEPRRISWRRPQALEPTLYELR